MAVAASIIRLVSTINLWPASSVYINSFAPMSKPDLGPIGLANRVGSPAEHQNRHLPKSGTNHFSADPGEERGEPSTSGGDIRALIAYIWPMIENGEQNDLVALLNWYHDMGADAVLGDTPINWLSRGESAPGSAIRRSIRARQQGAAAQLAPHDAIAAAPGPLASAPPAAAGPQPPRRAHREQTRPTPAPTPVPAPARRFPTKAPDEAVLQASKEARAAADLPQLQDILGKFEGCGLKATAKNLCFFRGAETARVMVIGEAPGRDEDLAGKPFVGRAGQLLDKMLAAIDLTEANCHITNIVYWRPPGNRTPTPQEALVCRPFLRRQIELVNPEIILLLGGAAAKNILNASEGIMRLRGKWRQLDRDDASSPPINTSDKAPKVEGIKALATLHPAYLLRTPAAKRLAWRDLLMIKEKME